MPKIPTNTPKTVKIVPAKVVSALIIKPSLRVAVKLVEKPKKVEHVILDSACAESDLDAPKKRKTRSRSPGLPPDLTKTELRILAAMVDTSQGRKEITRQELTKKTGIKKNWTERLGASTKEGSSGMEGKGYIRSSKHEGSTRITYYITKKGLNTVEEFGAVIGL